MDVTPPTHRSALRQLGELTVTVGENPVDGHFDLNVVSSGGRTRPPAVRPRACVAAVAPGWPRCDQGAGPGKTPMDELSRSFDSEQAAGRAGP